MSSVCKKSFLARQTTLLPQIISDTSKILSKFSEHCFVSFFAIHLFEAIIPVNGKISAAHIIVFKAWLFRVLLKSTKYKSK